MDTETGGRSRRRGDVSVADAGRPRSSRARTLLGAGALALLATPSTAHAQDQVVRGASVPPAASAPALPQIGLMVDAGVPDGAQAALAYRPAAWARLYAGGGYNLISKSVAGGLSLIPFGAGPSLTVEGGHYFDGDANGLARRFAGSAFSDQAVLERVGYDYGNAHLGLELGKRRFTFFIHGGLSYVRATVHNLDAQINGKADVASSGATVSFNQDPVVKVIGPSLKLGFVLYLF